MATSKEMTAGPALPLIFNFTLPLLFGNLLQQTYSLVDAAIVGKFCVSYSGFLQRMLWRIRYPRGTEVWGEGL